VVSTTITGVTQQRHRTAWRLAEYLGLVTDKPKPKVGSRQWWLVISGAAVWGLTVVVLARLLGFL
jgi:hypothetical protein